MIVKFFPNEINIASNEVLNKNHINLSLLYMKPIMAKNNVIIPI